MALKMNTSLKQVQGQNLILTPQLQQAIKLLTMTHTEMTNLIAQEMVENPMLEDIDENPNHGENDQQQTDCLYHLESLEKQNKEISSQDLREPSENVDLKKQDNFDFEKYLESYNTYSSSNSGLKSKKLNNEAPNYENMVTREKTLAEHLESQIIIEDLDERDALIAKNLIYNINDKGYLKASLEEISIEVQRLSGKSCTLKDVEIILSMIQTLDPVGCGARTLKECLLIQAQILEYRMPLIERIIDKCLEHLQKKNWNKIASLLSVEKKQVLEASELILKLHPKPGRLISPELIHYIVPDIFVRNVGEEFKVEINNEGVPSLKISGLYKKILSQEPLNDPEKKLTKKYMQDKTRHAMQLIKSIYNRQSTIFRVSEAIVRYQQDFFHKGTAFLRPMLMKDIANELDIHESTVSRVTSNKYMNTSLGVFELKYFFNNSVGGQKGGIDIASESLKLKIKLMIEKENPMKALSDQKIVNLLKTQDIVVARRTVTKYRQLLNIQPSSTRKRSI